MKQKLIFEIIKSNLRFSFFANQVLQDPYYFGYFNIFLKSRVKPFSVATHTYNNKDKFDFLK